MNKNISFRISITENVGSELNLGTKSGRTVFQTCIDESIQLLYTTGNIKADKLKTRPEVL